MTALDRALPLADRPHRAVRIGHHLHLDVMTGVEVALAEHRGIAEGGLRLALRGLDLPGQLAEFADHAHAAAPAAGRRLDQYRQHVGGHRVRVELVEHRNPGGGHHLLGFDLGAHRGHRGHGRPDPRQPCVDHGGREVGVLRKESVPGVDGVGAGSPRGCDQLGGVEVPAGALETHPDVGFGDVRCRCVGIGVHGDGADTQPSAGGEHPPGDLATVGDQNASDHGCSLLAISAWLSALSDGEHAEITSGRRRSSTSPRSVRWRSPTGTCPTRCGCPAGR
ncbi:hypothetical protein MOBUDSM44075_03061 [Mycolicibacterium obuense]|uniref:Uncharacterized protein n=1 Tax=Mycolicibacterium obuense TaxID=1807 RepID=A0A0J6VX79_9MYCO|nr:hypothetical protein MOBUDSM44075_03061 [Mycolicibacterium obuense]